MTSLPVDQLINNYSKYREDPWVFLTECVYTLDAVRKDEPVRRFPDKPYLKLMTRIWQKYNMCAFPKSRRMTASWTIIGLYVWDAIFHKGRNIAFVSRKEEGSDDLVKRAKFIVDHLDQTKIPKDLIPKYRSVENILEFPEINSKIQGFPQGADQLRQFTFSGILGDECAFWEYAEKFYSASLPTIDGGGRMTLISSPAPGFFKKLCFDAMDAIGDIVTSEYAPAFKRAMEGVRIWKNEKNKFVVFELHYTADEGKRSSEYKESIKNSMPLQEYLREYELYWDTFSGQPVYPEFGNIHVIDNEPFPTPGLPMLVGIDWGLTPAAVIGQLDEGVLTIFEELTETNMGAIRFIDKLTKHIKITYPTFGDLKKNWLCFVDPAGNTKAQSDESTCFQIAGKHFSLIPGPMAWEERKNSVVHFLMKLEQGKPAFQIYEKKCPMLTKGFRGGYRYSDKSIEIEQTKLRPIKDMFSHVHDSTQYLCSGVKNTTGRLSGRVPVPSYFQNTGPRHNDKINIQ